ncbi:MAG: hypothetical protein RLP96_03830, partial [Alphaproteobacteria bacterium]
AVDLHRVLDPKTAQSLWRASQGTDKGVFARRLAQWGDREAIATIRDRFDKDSDFRGYVQRYIRQFRVLMRQAATTDPDDMLSTTILTADVGKLYLLLDRSVGSGSRDVAAVAETP